ncbi:biotin synthase [Rhodoferax sp.]|uniref:biotin synthase n=1 Tax=Rhodoferax sp. TaxID=50421 RepID=UPI00276F3D4A|nr:biotin synthase [Rhodoferax sp.]
MTEQRPPTIDPAAARRWQQFPATQTAWLHEEVARRMQERLQWIRLQPQNWAHWESVRGGLAAHRELVRRYPKSQCFVVESDAQRARHAAKLVAPKWWQGGRWLSAPTRFELPSQGAVQMVWANMLLHMCAQPQALMAQWHQALAVDGFVMFSCLGPDTLTELRGVYQSLGWAPPAHEFTDMHDWGDMLVQAGFAEPVMDMERITLSFADPARLLRELRELGRNLHPERHPALRGRQWRQRLLQALDAQLRGPSGELALTFEVVYGHAFKPAPRHTVRAQTILSLEQMRASLNQRKTYRG